jgi:Acetyltransferases
MIFSKIEADDKENITKLSKLASAIVKEHFDPIIGSQQNDYMISKFQTVDAISKQLAHGYQYYFCILEKEIVGFLAFYKKGAAMCLSKFYLKKEYRGKGLSKDMLAFTADMTRNANVNAIVLNVNRNNSAVIAYEHMGFRKIREEVNDIGSGFVMDDFVMQYDINK